MSALNRRLDALEEIAEMVRLREVERVVREVASDRGLDPERLLEIYRECRARTAALRAQGLTDEQIITATAERNGLTVGELRARCDEMRARFD